MSENKELSTAGYLPTSARVWPLKRYAEMHKRSLDDPESFWAEQARQLDWAKTWRKSKVAIYWEGENGDTRVLSYSTLYRDVNRYAYVLQKLGIKKGDRVAVSLDRKSVV